MNPPVPITTALCVASSDLEMLLQGRLIVALSRSFISGTPHFALCPADLEGGTIPISAWAKLASCKIYSSSDEIQKLSLSTGLKYSALQAVLQERHKIFLACLRVYQLPQIANISAARIDPGKLGSFIKLPNQLIGTTDLLVLEDVVFQRRTDSLLRLETPQNLDVERLHDEILATFPSSDQAKLLLQDFRSLLDWSHLGAVQWLDPDLSWIKTVASTGNSSDGDAFEKLVRKSLIKLGFTNSLNSSKAGLDPDKAGGAGGIDVYCDAPFSLVGECKASKYDKTPNKVSGQLIHLGNTHLGMQQFAKSVKVIFAAGSLTKDAEQAAIQNQMNVMRPETLQRLVELKAKHPGSINLLELKPCLEEPPFGKDADKKVNDFIDRVWERLQVRSHLVKLVQDLGGEVNIDGVYGAYVYSKPSKVLDKWIIKNILTELASPLTGYIGRKPTKDGERFYFLRPFDLLDQ